MMAWVMTVTVNAAKKVVAETVDVLLATASLDVVAIAHGECGDSGGDYGGGGDVQWM